MKFNGRCIIYCRTSSEKADDTKVSIELQEEYCQKLATINKLEVIQTYIDRNQSGRMWPDVLLAEHDKDTADRYGNERRIGFTKVIEHLNNCDIDYILCYDPTRFARPKSTIFSGFLEQVLIRSNAMLLTHTKGKQDLKDFAQNLVNIIDQKIVSAELEKNRAASILAKELKRDQGYLVCAPCFGYVSAGPQKVNIVPGQADIVADIFDRFVNNNHGYNKIAGDLELAGVEGMRTNRWHQATIYRIIRNPSYIGKAYNTKNQLIDSKVYQPIIDPALWFKAQTNARTFKNTGKQTRNYEEDYPLSGGLLICAGCGHPMSARTRKTRWENKDGSTKKSSVAYYTCKNNHSCRNKASIKAEDIHEILRELAAGDALRWAKFMAKFLELKALTISSSGELQQIQDLETQLKELNEAKQEYKDTYLTKPKLLTEMLNKVEDQELKLNNKLERLVKSMPINFKFDGDSSTGAGLKSYTRALFSKITIYRRKKAVFTYRVKYSCSGSGFTVPATVGKANAVMFELTDAIREKITAPNKTMDKEGWDKLPYKSELLTPEQWAKRLNMPTDAILTRTSAAATPEINAQVIDSIINSGTNNE